MVLKQMMEKKRIVPLLIFLIAMAWYYYAHKNTTTTASDFSCTKRVLEGETMGTTYRVVYCASFDLSKTTLDSLLAAQNAIFSHYDPNSELSLINKKNENAILSPKLKTVLETSKQIYEETNHAFDPTISPLVSAYGFGPKDKEYVLSEKVIDSLLTFVNFGKMTFSGDSLIKSQDNQILNLSAIAKGYVVDEVASFVSAHGVTEYMVEIGGEIVCGLPKGKKDPWVIGIEKPAEGEREIHSKVQLSSIAMATSGNYRNFYVKDGKKYSHTIDPSTGGFVKHGMLSVSVLAKNCMVADAFATSFMVMGPEKTIAFVSKRNDLDVFLIYHESGLDKVFMTPGFKQRIKNDEK